MSRSLRIIFRRDPSRDHHKGEIAFEGYKVFWPNGEPVTVGLDSFCKHGQRLLGLGKHLKGCSERLIELICIPLKSRDCDMTRIPGHRVRRFCLKREGNVGRVHFLDGTPTATVFTIDHDEPKVLEWIGLPDLKEGDQQWIDLAARPI
ncbi:MAG: hypothetical protein KatS3mg105_1872 [Gemmatales bacterium]|nr:MAG: hypothetical protein KatS3mg105_1872 [Gemmatales bacterium]